MTLLVSAATTTLIAATLAASAALAATIYRFWRDEQHWRSENRLAAYVEFIDVARRFLFLCDDVGSPALEDVDLPADVTLRRQKMAVREEIRLLRQATTKVVMLGPNELADEASAVLDFFADELYPRYVQQDVPPGEASAVVPRAADLLKHFQTSAADRLDIFRKAK